MALWKDVPTKTKQDRERHTESVTDHLTGVTPFDRQALCCIDCGNAQVPTNIMDAIAVFCMGEVRCKKGQCTQTDDIHCPAYTGDSVFVPAPAN